MKEVFIDIFGIHILEPVTSLTDIILSVFCFYFYKKLNFPSHRALLGKYWRLFFLFIGIATFVGATAHGLRSYFGGNVFYYIWMLMNISSIPSSYYLLKATIELSEFQEELKTKLTYIALFSMILLTVLTIIINNFVLIKINAVIVILLALIKHYLTYKKGYHGSGYIFFGFTFSLTSAIVHTAQFSINENWFNYKDISHVIMNISLYIIFIGVLLKTKPVVPIIEQPN